MDQVGETLRKKEISAILEDLRKEDFILELKNKDKVYKVNQQWKPRITHRLPT